MFLYMHSVLGWGSFCMNYCISGIESISLWPFWGAMEAQVASIAAFSSSALLGLVSHLPVDNTPYIFYGVQNRQVCWPIKHSNPLDNKPGIGTWGNVGRCQDANSTQLSMNMLGCTASLWRLSMIVFCTTFKSAVFHMIVKPTDPFQVFLGN